VFGLVFSHTEPRDGPEPSSVEADVYIWRFALLVVHARKEEEEEAKRLAWGKRLRNGLFCVEWDVRPQLSQSMLPDPPSGTAYRTS